MNKLPRLKAFLTGDALQYSNLQIEWIGGHIPTAYFRNALGEIVSEEKLPNMPTEEIVTWFTEKGLTLTVHEAPDYGAPTATATFEEHYYELFEINSMYQHAQKFAESREHNGNKGYILTISNPNEAYTLLQAFFKEEGLKERRIWLGASDAEIEGRWKWVAGPENDQLFHVHVKHEIASRAADDKPWHVDWAMYEPNNGGGGIDEDCITWTSAGWNDENCLSSALLIVEYGESALPVFPGARTAALRGANPDDFNNPPQTRHTLSESKQRQREEQRQAQRAAFKAQQEREATDTQAKGPADEL